MLDLSAMVTVFCLVRVQSQRIHPSGNRQPDPKSTKVRGTNLLSLSFVKLKKLPEGCNQMQEVSIYVFFFFF